MTLNSKYDLNVKDGRSDGAEKRASTVYWEQIATLQDIDANILGHPQGSDGPLVQRLKSFVGPKPLVVGKYGDLNSGLRQLIDAFAKSAGAAKWKEYNYRSEEIATARIKVHFSRLLGLAAHKGQARLLLDRIHAFNGRTSSTNPKFKQNCRNWDFWHLWRSAWTRPSDTGWTFYHVDRFYGVVAFGYEAAQ